MNSGIYKISSIKDPSLFYIGSTSNFKKRRNDHKVLKKAMNPLIKNLIKINGHNDIKFEIIKKCKIYELPYYEQYYISELNPTLNINKFVDINNGYKNGKINMRAVARKDIRSDIINDSEHMLGSQVYIFVENKVFDLLSIYDNFKFINL